MKITKYITSKLLVLTFVAFTIQSCSDFLDEKLISDVSAGSYYTTAAGLEDAVDASYSFLREIHSNERAYMLTIFGTDTHTNGADGGYKSFNFYDNGLNPAVNILDQQWTFLYQGINQANAVLNRSEAVTNMSDAIKTQRRAEVRFLRAYYYFYLVQTWGDVYLTLEETIGAEVEAAPSPQSAVYSEAIIPDLEFAIANLPETQSNYGRATKGAAEFLLAKAYLTRGYQSFGSPADFASANTLFSNVINDRGYALVDSHDALWDQDNQLNSEIIWAVQYSTDLILNGGNGGVGNRGHLYFLMEYDIRPGMIRDINGGRPFKRFRPTDYMVSVWEETREIDDRYDQTYKHAYISNNPNNIPKWEQIHVDNNAVKADGSTVTSSDIGSNRFEVGDTAIFVPGPGRDAEWMTGKKLQVRYNVITKDAAFEGDQYIYTERLFPTLSKFIDPRRPTIQWERGSRDWFVMRLADAHLLRAEARFQTGNNAGAAEDINVVRTRAAKEGAEAAMQITAADVDLDLILKERALEMDGEQCRWFDLARTGKLVEYVRAYNPLGADNIEDYHIHRPIPLTQIDRTLGGYPQNCGYPGSDCN
ncbi:MULTISPECIES: RagB/SusD family nutrient uptake outer membrane protein [unclassified Imperialibacter]|uniref:RagB/SusD family nutrient uptake outer membrane protein n=1 Tax=unclassified Imperialibacter TaxID=2629706 RepID=UPI001251F2D6|nr:MULTISPECIES: RagB/SusD family nutrient uptake outer membrane protein [unclassified Imperialibacter]CAD5267917.1 putative outer membrane protein, probably involved in nutrient binding protein [Imperialibacter sp. 75]CAD5280444.1 putative outer membrane protein, probably involved in nutrient binding protein [Imperialibacter sp. 89]VVT01417.1 putative outer membrane protein, probably involved in nutrient binding protein [Imperialibacter sp. EC-SDR9]